VVARLEHSSCNVNFLADVKKFPNQYVCLFVCLFDSIRLFTVTV
jgi:hypothetical protein